MSQIDEILPEYEREDSNGKHKTVFATFGLAVYWSQCLEQSCSLVLSLKKIRAEGAIPNKRVNEIVDSFEMSKRTLGQYVNEIKQACRMSEASAARLKQLLEQRNRIVHRYFREEIDEVYSETGRRKILDYLCSFVDEAKEVDEKLKELYMKHAVSLGIDMDMVEEEFQRRVQESE